MQYHNMSTQQYTTTGATALYVLMTWMRDRRMASEARTLVIRGGLGLLGTLAYNVMNNNLADTRSFWATARYLLATYGAYEAFQLVRFNLDAYKWGLSSDLFEVVVHNHHPSKPNFARMRANSRLALSDCKIFLTLIFLTFTANCDSLTKS